MREVNIARSQKRPRRKGTECVGHRCNGRERNDGGAGKQARVSGGMQLVGMTEVRGHNTR